MGRDRISILIQNTGSPNLGGLQPGMIRLYPGGLAALHSLEEYRCGPTRCEGFNDATKLATRLVLFNWHHGTAFGVSVIHIDNPLEDSELMPGRQSHRLEPQDS
jgi:hypothetical protein